jgi:hypothetical protein
MTMVLVRFHPRPVASMSDSYMTIELADEVIECGATVTGVVSWSGPKTPRSVSVTLQYKTEGRGSTDKGEASTVQVPADNQGYHQFFLATPSDGPISFDGDLISVIWEIELRLDLKGRRDPKGHQRVEVLPRSV